jgi:hypothetical protein
MNESLIERLKVSCLGLDAVDPLRLLVDDVIAALAQRTWVGLTKDEVDSWNLPDHPTVFEFAQFIEAKLKQKNHVAQETNS